MMPRRECKPPTYGLHRATGQARVVINGKSHYLGRYGSPESRVNYARLVAEWEASSGLSSSVSPTTEGDIKVVELVARYLTHVRTYYMKNGCPTDEQESIRQALRHVTRLYDHTPVARFGPLALKAVRQAMIDADWCRSHINRRIGRVKRMFRWGVEDEFAPPSLYHALQAVTGLRYGRSGVRESKPVKPVCETQVDAIRPYVSRQVWAMIELQRLTGMRPGEARMMRGCDLDMSGSLWEYRPASHKTEHQDKQRVIPIGPRAQAVIHPFLKPDLNAFLFNPQEAEAVRNNIRRQNRKSPMTPSQRRRTPKGGTLHELYSKDAFVRAIRRACEKAVVPPWHPNQLRHTSGTQIRKECGLELGEDDTPDKVDGCAENEQ